jgi:uncharacterized protein YkwD
VAHSRLVISLCALCLCACVGIPPAYGSFAASAKVQTESAHAKRKAHRSQACTNHSSSDAGKRRSQRVPTGKTSSFHATNKHGGRTPSKPGCQKSRTKPHHPAVTPKPAPAPAPQSPSNSQPSNSASTYGQTPTPPSPTGAAACTGTTLVPDKHDLESIRAAVVCLVNRERAAQGETALTPNEQLEQSAQGHTDSMVSENYFEHISPQGETPVMRMRAAGYIYSSRIGYDVGENIGWGTLADSTPRMIVAAWMASPGHRANILNSHFRDTAVGVSPSLPSSLTRNQAGGIYTQDFGVITTG